MRWEIAIALGLAVAAAGGAQTAQQILERIAETYRNLQSCHFAAVTVSTTHVGSTSRSPRSRWKVERRGDDRVPVDRLCRRPCRLVRQETLEAGGKRIDCYVIEVDDESGVPTTYWIDKTGYLMVQEQIGAGNATNTKLITFMVAEVNQPVSADLFTVAPPGAK